MPGGDRPLDGGHPQVLPVAPAGPALGGGEPVGLGGFGGQLLQAPGEGDGAVGTARVVERVGAQAQLGVPGEEPEVVAVEREPGPEGLLGQVVVVVLVLGGVAQGEPAVEVGLRAERVEALLRGPAHGRVAAREEELFAAGLVGVERGRAVPSVCTPVRGRASLRPAASSGQGHSGNRWAPRARTGPGRRAPPYPAGARGSGPGGPGRKTG
ncbi:hypothetical protein [Streptomyces sp. NPDC090093]|uniref:hypothetical protein n=1 Tax=Streptomyces sp. NPDC090093 TaxID=3365945 RepID=UPI0038268831